MDIHAEEPLSLPEARRRRGARAREEEEARREHFLTLLEEAERVHPYALTVLGDRWLTRRLAGRAGWP
jgi:hypothetical protein